MFKKINNIVFTTLFLLVFFIPLLFTKWESGGVSLRENRNLAPFPALTIDGEFNLAFTGEFETWFMDHMGFRSDLIDANTKLMENVFDRSLTTSDVKIGKTGDFIYAPTFIIEDYAHVNLRTEEDITAIGQSYQIINDWLDSKEIPFYYIQCVDKHTIYPERFIPAVMQIGTVSKTDQVMAYLQEETSVNAIYFKEILEANRLEYNVFSHWGDSTHWTCRGAYISYQYMMERINENMASPLRILREEDYDITVQTEPGPNGQIEQVEYFYIRNPNAISSDISDMGPWSEDIRHSIWINPEADNNVRLLLMADSYFNGYLLDSIAESFREVWLVWGDYTLDLPEIVELCDPDMVIYECAERVDRSDDVCILADNLINYY